MSEYSACARIGQTGDLAGFRDCIRDAWDGFEGAAGAASTNAEDAFDDVDEQCLTALRRYRSAVNRMYAVNATANEVAQSLQLELFEEAFKPIPRTARRYANASTRARDACRPS